MRTLLAALALGLTAPTLALAADDAPDDRPAHARGKARGHASHGPSARPPAPRPAAVPARPASRPPARPAARPPARPAAVPARPAPRPPARAVVYPRPPVVVVPPPVVVRPPPRVIVTPPPPRRPPVVVQPAPRVVVQPAPQVVVQQQPVVETPSFREKKWALGVRSGVMMGGHHGSGAYGDFGLGLTARYHPVGALGLELNIAHHNSGFRPDSVRAQTTGSLSADVFLTPKHRFSPYLIGGLTLTGRHRDLAAGIGPSDLGESGRGLLFGPHGGLGLEIGLTESWALDLDARGIGYVNVARHEPTAPGAFQANVGIVSRF